MILQAATALVAALLCACVATGFGWEKAKSQATAEVVAAFNAARPQMLSAKPGPRKVLFVDFGGERKPVTYAIDAERGLLEVGDGELDPAKRPLHWLSNVSPKAAEAQVTESITRKIAVASVQHAGFEILRWTKKSRIRVSDSFLTEDRHMWELWRPGTSGLSVILCDEFNGDKNCGEPHGIEIEDGSLLLFRAVSPDDPAYWGKLWEVSYLWLPPSATGNFSAQWTTLSRSATSGSIASVFRRGKSIELILDPPRDGPVVVRMPFNATTRRLKWTAPEALFDEFGNRMRVFGSFIQHGDALISFGGAVTLLDQDYSVLASRSVMVTGQCSELMEPGDPISITQCRSEYLLPERFAFGSTRTTYTPPPLPPIRSLSVKGGLCGRPDRIASFPDKAKSTREPQHQIDLLGPQGEAVASVGVSAGPVVQWMRVVAASRDLSFCVAPSVEPRGRSSNSDDPILMYSINSLDDVWIRKETAMVK